MELEHLRVPPGTDDPFVGRDPADRLGLTDQLLDDRFRTLSQRLLDLQYRLEAESERSVVLVLQGMAASGKDEAIRAALRGLNPQACQAVHFTEPDGGEAEHDYLWRYHRALPPAGHIGMFNRSHAEAVVGDRVHARVDETTWTRRFRHINDFERTLHDEGIELVKVFLHLSRDEQAARLRTRLERPERRWEFDREDLDERDQWDEFEAAYAACFRETSTEVCPWFVVPADVPEVRDVAILALLAERLEEMDPQFPDGELDDDEVAAALDRLGDGPTSEPASRFDRLT